SFFLATGLACGPQQRYFIKRLIRAVEHGFPAGKVLPPLDGNVRVCAVDVDRIANPSNCFRGDDRGARTEERIVNGLTRLRMIEHRSLHALDRFWGAVVILGLFTAHGVDLPKGGLTSVPHPVRICALLHRKKAIFVLPMVMAARDGKTGFSP